MYGVIYDTKLFYSKRIKTYFPTWDYFKDRKKNKKYRKDVRVYRYSLPAVPLTEHYKLFNLFMTYDIHKARNLFNYLFLSRSFYSCYIYSSEVMGYKNCNCKSLACLAA